MALQRSVLAYHSYFVVCIFKLTKIIVVPILRNVDETIAGIIKRKVNGAEGRVRPAPKLFDKDKVPMDEVVGNGSEVKIQYSEWETSNKFGDFKGLDLQAVQVLDLVTYRTGDGDELGSVEGGEEF